MKAFWWFKDTVAGMARPGFNFSHWFDFPFEEALVYGWLGQRSSGTYSIQSLREHIDYYGPKIRVFHGIDETHFSKLQDDFRKDSKIWGVLQNLKSKTQTVEAINVEGHHIQFDLNSAHLKNEIEFLKSQGIRRIVALTEVHHQAEILKDHFDLHHIAIEDLTPPEFSQVEKLAKLIEETRNRNEKIVVHCMAGIGRTSTMLTAAHMILGEKYEPLKKLLAQQNPFFKLTGSQADFLDSVAKRLGQL